MVQVIPEQRVESRKLVDMLAPTREIRSELCTGCRCCELACSFHFARAFDPANSSIQVRGDHQTGEIWLDLHPTCDLCRGEEEPLCVRFCARGVLTPEILGLGGSV